MFFAYGLYVGFVLGMAAAVLVLINTRLVR